MAGIDQTFLNAYISKGTDEEQKKYNRKAGLIDFALFNTPFQTFMDEELKSKIAGANNRAIDISVLVNDNPDVARALSYSFDANLSESAKVRVTIVDAWTGFNVSPDIHANNTIDAVKYKADRLAKADKALAKVVAGDIYASLNAKRTQVLDDSGAPSGDYDFDATNDALKITLSAQEDNPFFNDVATIAEANELDGDFNIVATSGIKFATAYKQLYGSGNSKNLMADGMPAIFTDNTNSIVRGANSRSTGFMVQNGAISLVPSIPVSFAEAYTIGAYAQFGVGSEALPISGMKPLLYIEEDKANNSALGGAAMGKVIKYGVGLRYAIVTQYIDDQATDVNNIIKLEMLNS